MRSASDALGIDPDCSADELKVALDAAIKKSINADASISEAREQADAAIAVMEKKIAAAEKAQALAEDAKAQALAAQKKAEQLTVESREAQAKEMKKLKAQLAETEKTLKSINKALADTPENVVKKLKTLKKQKDDEAAARKLVSNEVTSLRKEKRAQEQRITVLKAALEQSGKLAEQYRELHTQCEEMHAQFAPLVKDANDLAAVPALDESLLESIEEAAKAEEK